jgi:ribosome-binding factor A
MRTPSSRCLWLLLPALALGWMPAASVRPKYACQRVACHPSMRDGRRQGRVGQVIRAEVAHVIREAHSVGSTRIPSGVRDMISVVDVDMSPDLRNARVKVSIIGERKDKISAVRWLRGNVRGLRHEIAKRNRHMKRIPELSFHHVDVGAATDMMVKLQTLRAEDEAAERARGDGDDDDDGLDFDGLDDDSWLDEDDEDFDDEEDED